MRVLISGIGTSVGLGILKSLRQDPLITFIAGCDNRLSAHSYMVDDFIIVPKVEEIASPDIFIDIINKLELNVVFTASEYETAWFSDYKNEIEDKSSAKVIACKSEFIKLGEDKLATYQHLHKHQIPVLDFWYFSEKSTWISGKTRNPINESNFPIFAKPRNGTSSKGIISLDSFSLLKSFTSSIKPGQYVLQATINKALMPIEITSSVVIIDSITEDVLSPFHSKRILNKGISWKVNRISSNILDSSISSIASTFSGYEGSLNVQYLASSDLSIFFPLEINTRLSGTTSFRSCCGHNEPSYLMRNALGLDNKQTIKNAQKSCSYSPTMFRYVEDFIVE